MNVSFVGLILIVALAILLLLIIMRAGKKALILIPMIVLGALFLPVIISHQRRVARLSLIVPDFGLVQDVQNQSAIWNEAIDDYLEADHYASMEDAARFLANKLATAFKGTDTWNKMLIFGAPDTSRRTLDAFSDTIRSQLNLNDVEVMLHRPRVLPDDPNVILCDLSVLNLHSSHQVVNGLPITTKNGTLKMHIENRSNIMDRSADFIQKDWINSLASVPNQGHSAVMVARSSGSCMDEAEAQDQAMAQAAIMVQSLLRQTKQDTSILKQEIIVTPQDLRTNECVADQFTQSLRTSTARVWRHAVLLNLDPHRLQSLLQQKTRQIQRQHKTWAQDLLSLAGLALVVFILYIFLNAATKGYYAWSLRVVAVVTVVGIVVILLLT